MGSKDMELWIKRAFLVCCDICAVAGAGVLALLLRFDFSYDGIPGDYLAELWRRLPFLAFSTVAVFAFFHLYSSLWRYAGAREFFNIILGCMLADAVGFLAFARAQAEGTHRLPLSFYPLYGAALGALVFAGRYAYRGVRSLAARRPAPGAARNVLVVGAGAAGKALLKEIQDSPYLHMNVVGVIDDDRGKAGAYIQGEKILGGRDQIIPLASRLHVEEIIIAMPSASPKEIKDILDICKQTGCRLKRLPGIYQIVNGSVSVGGLKEVDINDLLGREPVQVDLDAIMGYVSGRVVLVTGGGGSIGSELCRQVAARNPRQLILLDIYENSAYEVQNELLADYPGLNLEVLIASVRNTKRMDMIFEQYRPDIVYHAAAHKHVPLMEGSPNEAVKNNVLGTWKVVQAADRWQVKKFVMISTDKAVNPTNIMGATKRVCEMIIQAYDRRSGTEFAAVRFGNVLGSNGSVIPLFRKQIARGGPVTVTHPEITRYFMTIPEAVSLVLQAGAFAKGGEIFVLDMGEPVRIVDLARNLILLSGYKPGEDIKIVFTGLRPGEKLYEELLMEEEGLQETGNRLIHIGKPIAMDEGKFMEQLERLRDYVVEEPGDIREMVGEIVDTYTYAAQGGGGFSGAEAECHLSAIQ